MGFSKNKILDRDRVESMWSRLHEPWVKLAHVDNPTWNKTCPPILDALLEELEPNKFQFTLQADGDVDLLICQLLWDSENAEQAFREGDELIFEFIAMGCEAMGAARPVLPTEATEVRFKTLAINKEGDLYGLDEGGTVYRAEGRETSNRMKRGWVKLSMHRFDEEQ